jgi:PST family polysaccharide transporter
MAILQGVRKIKDLALVNIISVFVGSIASIIIYWLYGIDGVVPSLISLALFNFLVSFYYARRLELEIVKVSWRDTLLLAGSVIGLGLAFMWTGIMRSLTEYGTRWLIINEIDFASVGIFFAAYRLSGMFLNFVLGAMGTDFYPNLTAASGDHEAMRGLVNQQTEVGLLLALPGLLMTLALSSLVVRMFYSSEFVDAIPLLQWFVLGCLGRVISWPMGYTLLAKGRGDLLVICETAGQCFHLAMIYLFLNHFGLIGVSIAFVLNYIVWTLLLMVVSYYLIGYRWSPSVLSLVLFSVIISAVCFAVVNFVTGILGQAMGLLLAVFVGFYCLRKLCGLVGQEHPLVRLVGRIPILRSIVFYG